ncbi:hypothetical protein Hanom_Chr01g00046171 [Helianthus anomalus]
MLGTRKGVWRRQLSHQRLAHYYLSCHASFWAPFLNFETWNDGYKWGVDLKKSKIFPNYFNHRFSFLGFSSMTPKTSSRDETIYFKWNKTSFELLLQTYCIKPERHLVMSSERDIAFPMKDDKIILFADFFKFFNFRLPITAFCKSMLDEYLRHFEYACLSLGFLPESLILCALYTLVWKAPFFTFDCRSTDEAFLRFLPSSSRDKDWKKKFFFIDVDVIPRGMHCSIGE